MSQTQFDYTQTYYKILNKNRTHHGYRYNSGLNILNEPFQPNGSCVPGGFYFTNLENIHNFYVLGSYIVKVTVPPNAQVVKDTSHNATKWRTDRIILGDQYQLFSITTVAQLKIPITKYWMDQMKKNNGRSGYNHVKKNLKKMGCKRLKYRNADDYVYTPPLYPYNVISDSESKSVIDWYRIQDSQSNQETSNINQKSLPNQPVTYSIPVVTYSYQADTTLQNISTYLCVQCNNPLLSTQFYCSNCGIKILWN